MREDMLWLAVWVHIHNLVLTTTLSSVIWSPSGFFLEGFAIF